MFVMIHVLLINLVLNGIVIILKPPNHLSTKTALGLIHDLCAPQVGSHMEAEWQMSGTNVASGHFSKALLFFFLSWNSAACLNLLLVRFNFSFSCKAQKVTRNILKMRCKSLKMHNCSDIFYMFLCIMCSIPCASYFLCTRVKH